MKRWIWPSVMPGEFRLRRQPLGQGLGADAVHREPAAVVGDFQDDVAAFVEGVQNYVAGFRFASRAPLGRGLEPVIAAVADHVRQRILDQLQHLAVEFGLGTEHGELDLFAHIMG
jgi:hypothetical protein